MSLHPRHDATISELDRVLKQRNALLKSAGARRAGGRPLPPDVVHTLDVWDAKLAEVGEALAAAREALTAALEPLVSAAYGRLARAWPTGAGPPVGLTYQRSWDGRLCTRLWSVLAATICAGG